MLRRLYEHCIGTDRGVCEWTTKEQVRGRLHPRQQRSIHLHSETTLMKRLTRLTQVELEFIYVQL